MPDLPDLLSVSQAVRESGFSRRTIHLHIIKGHLKAQKLEGGRNTAYVIERRDFHRWLAKRVKALRDAADAIERQAAS